MLSGIILTLTQLLSEPYLFVVAIEAVVILAAAQMDITSNTPDRRLVPMATATPFCTRKLSLLRADYAVAFWTINNRKMVFRSI